MRTETVIPAGNCPNRLCRLLLFGLSVCLMLFGMPGKCLVWATETEGSGTGTTITATTVAVSQPEFTVSIPSGIPIGNVERTEESAIQSATFEVGVSGITFLNGKKILVSVSTADGQFQLTDGTHKLPYAVYCQSQGGAALQSGDVFGTFTADRTVTGRVEVDSRDIPAAGTYSGLLIFTVSVQDEGE